MELITETTVIVGVAIMTVGWIANTWMRMKHGYPLENSWGKAVYPKNDQAIERVKLLTQENAELRAELGSMKDRLANVERIVTDSGYHLTTEIESLREGRKDAN
ncbi:hypothetical protein [Aurantiacibacter poecillastricola]|uniref:hypothetical protein n=1 Tax=Aurantiacibacter poecillastricola TaxID=3064385 RepID=UPI00273E84D9|nr:hypothetical protein [Aurantiacibacter sp. 219JJ12-13]MDP5262979.1 hypothetical protein [Aurantiacibacter sp. 219JJ12-13]